MFPLTKLTPVSAGRLHPAALRVLTGECIGAHTMEPRQVQPPPERTITAGTAATIRILRAIEIAALMKRALPSRAARFAV